MKPVVQDAPADASGEGWSGALRVSMTSVVLGTGSLLDGQRPGWAIVISPRRWVMAVGKGHHPWSREGVITADELRYSEIWALIARLLSEYQQERAQ